MTQLGLLELVDFSLRKGTSPSVFQSLVQQLNHKQEIQLDQIKALISEDSEFEPMKLVYITTASLNNQATPFKMANIVLNLQYATQLNQALLLSAYISELRNDHIVKSFTSFNHFEISELVVSAVSYIKYLLTVENTKLAGSFALLLNNIISFLPQDSSSSIISQEQSEVLASFIQLLKSQKVYIHQEFEDNLASFSKKASIAVSLRQSISLTQSTSTVATHSSFLKSNKIPKYLWLNSLVENWETHHPGLVSAFEQFSKVKTSQNVLNELLAVSFEGYTTACQSHDKNSFFVYNWKLFLLKRLPTLIKSLNLKNLETSLTNAINLIDPKIIQSLKIASGGDVDTTLDDMFSSFPSTTTDIRHDFIRDCILLGLLPPQSFNTILRQDAAADSRPLPSVNNPTNTQSLEEKFNQTLLEINTEFISLEDSNILEFLNSFADMEGSKQEEASKLVVQYVHKFTTEDDSSRLYRLCLALGLVKDALHIILFHVSPRQVLAPIMNYLDKWETSNDEMNFQDSCFGGIFLLFLLIVKRFNIQLNDLISMKSSLEQPSFCISYLSRLGNCAQIDSQDSYKSEVLSSWINALFDSGGISDELMRVSTTQECFDILPNVFQQAFIACNRNIVDQDTVKGGLEYFLQPFLIGTTVGIFAWSMTYLWRQHDVSTLVNLLKPLIAPTDISGESLHLHKIVLSIYGSELYRALAHVDSTGTKIDMELLLALRQYEENDSSPGIFELQIASERNSGKHSDESSLLEGFHTLFYNLINWSQSSAVPTFEYHKFSNYIDFFGADVIIDYFISQITTAQTSNSKSFQLILEASGSILTSHYISPLSSTKASSLQALKSLELVDKAKTYTKEYQLLNVLIARKKAIKDDELNAEIFKLLFDKIYESIQTGTSI